MITIVHTESARFLVPSRTSKDQYLVDKQEWEGNGECGCPQFQFRIRPKLKEGKESGPWSRCWHINEVNAWIAGRVVKGMA